MTKRILGLRTVDCNRKSWGRFQWPSSGKVVAPDWEPTCECGQGLHALPWGIGDGGLLSWKDDAIWQAVWIDPDTMVNLVNKVKFPECEIAIDGTREEVIKFMIENGADGSKMVGGVVLANKLATADGYCGLATATHEEGTATANGEYGTAIAEGIWGFATANGAYGKATALALAGQATANGWGGEAVANGEQGQATANGTTGFATATGRYGQATANGPNGAAVASGEYGYAHSSFAASAGPEGVIVISGRPFGGDVVVGHVGKNGIEPGVMYKARDGKLVR